MLKRVQHDGILVAAVLLLLLASCIPSPRGRESRQPIVVRETPEKYRQCLADIGQLGAKVEALPDRVFPNGCTATSSVKMVAIGIPVTNLGAVKCSMAVPFVEWVQQAVQSAARDRLGTSVTRIESFGSFACRPVNNVEGGKLSEHGRANAVDIGGFVLADGRRISVKQGWNGPDADARAFLRQVHAAACRRFAIVLGPEANAFHQDHLHFDMGSGRYCR
jgi:hypothetical protein